MKTIVVCNFPRFSSEIWLPILWAQAKTYYENYGDGRSDWHWYPCYLDVYDADHEQEIKEELRRAKPDIFAMSLYVWNYRLAHKIAQWVKEQWPNCLVITGGPHQYLKHDMEWFKKHPYIDASLPGDSYGERPIKEILDNFKKGSVDWDQVTDIAYPRGNSRLITYSQKKMARADKKDYEFNWSGFTEQFSELKHFERYQQDKFPKSILLSVLETTRGCPYGCTYCDWGGGIATAVIQRDPDVVKRDIDSLCEFDLTYLYLSDANFGIFGDRDVDIIEYLIDQKQKRDARFKVGYGGFAKTENRIHHIKRILEADIRSSLSNNKEIKLSLQTLDKEILDNIDRKNIDLERQLEVFRPMAKDTHLPLYVEIIMGLPGMTLDKFYHELDVFGTEDLSIQWFEWILLPEAPSYSREYRDQWKIETTAKTHGWSYEDSHAQHEIVIGSRTYSSEDYLEMLLATGLYDLIIQGGFFKHSISSAKIGLGDLIRNFIAHHGTRESMSARWRDILETLDQNCSVKMDQENVYLGYYFPVLAFIDLDFVSEFAEWMSAKYQIPEKHIEQDLKRLNNVNRQGTTDWNGYTLQKFDRDGIKSIISKYRLFERNIMLSTDKLLGLITIHD